MWSCRYTVTAIRITGSRQQRRIRPEAVLVAGAAGRVGSELAVESVQGDFLAPQTPECAVEQRVEASGSGPLRSLGSRVVEVWQSNPDRGFLPVLEGEFTAEGVDSPLELPQAEPPAVAQVSLGAGRQ